MTGSQNPGPSLEDLVTEARRELPRFKSASRNQRSQANYAAEAVLGRHFDKGRSWEAYRQYLAPLRQIRGSRQFNAMMVEGLRDVEARYRPTSGDFASIRQGNYNALSSGGRAALGSLLYVEVLVYIVERLLA